MRESARRHERLEPRDDPGVRLRIDSVLPASIEVFIPEAALGQAEAPLVIHFMGATWVPMRAVATQQEPIIVAATYLGAGSGVYARPFTQQPGLYRRIRDSVVARVRGVGRAPPVADVYLSGWSAGYGAIREILRDSSDAASISGVLLLDGLHASYVPDRKPLADGGTIDTTGLMPFDAYAQRALRGDARFLVVHSEIFPGTFASTTETADWLLERRTMRREPVLEWGPMGSQQISRARRGRFEVLGFAGNTAPDHVDLFHGMGAFLARLLAL